MKSQLHAYADQELYDRCSMLAKEHGLSNSSFLKMLVCKAWDERKGGSSGEIKSLLNQAPVGAAVDVTQPSEVIRREDLKFEELVRVPRASVGSVRYPEFKKARKRHSSKKTKE